MIKNREETYWSQYYESGKAPEEPSLFAKYTLENYIKPGQALVEFGCGNGRDAHFFAENGIDVIAIDQCEGEIEELKKTNGQYKNLRYEAGDFTEMPDSDKKFDMVYSRFTLHSVTAEGQEKALEWSYRNLAPAGKLCIETRGQMNEIYGKGEPVLNEEDAFIYENHYRRFVDFNDFTQQIKSLGFAVLEVAEQSGFAPFQDTDYQFIRVIAQK